MSNISPRWGSLLTPHHPEKLCWRGFDFECFNFLFRKIPSNKGPFTVHTPSKGWCVGWAIAFFQRRKQCCCLPLPISPGVCVHNCLQLERILKIKLSFSRSRLVLFIGVIIGPLPRLLVRGLQIARAWRVIGSYFRLLEMHEAFRPPLLISIARGPYRNIGGDNNWQSLWWIRRSGVGVFKLFSLILNVVGFQWKQVQTFNFWWWLFPAREDRNDDRLMNWLIRI